MPLGGFTPTVAQPASAALVAYNGLQVGRSWGTRVSLLNTGCSGVTGLPKHSMTDPSTPKDQPPANKQDSCHSCNSCPAPTCRHLLNYDLHIAATPSAYHLHTPPISQSPQGPHDFPASNPPSGPCSPIPAPASPSHPSTPFLSAPPFSLCPACSHHGAAQTPTLATTVQVFVNRTKS